MSADAVKRPLSNVNPITNVVRPTTLQVANPEKKVCLIPQGVEIARPGYWDWSTFLDTQFQPLGEEESLSI